VTATAKGSVVVVIVTGLSGSGKTVALNAFEDSGFFCVDNLPTSLIDTFINLTMRTPSLSRIAIGVDIREKKFLSGFSEIVSSLRKKKVALEIIFLEADEKALIRRFKETRRPHPLGYKDLKIAIRTEVKLLDPIRAEADRIIDTSGMSPHDLRKMITGMYVRKGRRKMKVGIISFGYKYGVPPEADLLFDVRFLPNPNFVEELKTFSGRSPKVKEFVLSQTDTKEFMDRLLSLLEFLIPLYSQEGRSYLTIGIGCTGGRHRSPCISEEIGKALKAKKLNVSVTHRDIGL
jgi:UPF0042 nucleotide-binding protein